ncbi:MAG: arylsulfatase [Kiritimatiellae bacterium]|nr:arylsulfatase [Kiritimatiellia bacterium]
MKLHPWLATSILATTASVAAERPNVLLIYGDDVGWGDISIQGATKIRTPNIDRLAAQGLRFTDGHCASATCTPSRFSLLTGVHGFRHAIRVLAPDARLTIPTDRLTLPRVFKQAGYQTAVVGKWHLGLGAEGRPLDWNGEVKPGPMELGFDYSFLLPYTNDRVPCVYLDGHRVLRLDPSDPLFVGSRPPDAKVTEYPDGRKNPEAMTYYRSSHGHNESVINGIGRIGRQWGGQSALWNDETMTDEFVARSKTWLKDRDPSKPFFLFYAAQNIHVPRTPHPRFRGASELGYRGDSMVQFDDAVGELLKTLDELNLTDDTLVIFSSDNGPAYDDGYEDGTTVLTSSRESDRGHDASGPYRGGKYQIFEGGTRVPFILRWPGRIRPGVSNALVSQIDFIASFAALLRQPLPDGDAMDSRDTLSALLGQDRVGLPYLVEEAQTLALREGPWKFILEPKRPDGDELYHLERDAGETENLLQQHPEQAARMRQQLIRIREARGGIRSLERGAAGAVPPPSPTAAR